MPCPQLQLEHRIIRRFESRNIRRKTINIFNYHGTCTSIGIDCGRFCSRIIFRLYSMIEELQRFMNFIYKTKFDTNLHNS